MNKFTYMCKAFDAPDLRRLSDICEDAAGWRPVAMVEAITDNPGWRAWVCYPEDPRPVVHIPPEQWDSQS
jgi:hypothetical protein